MNNKLIWQVADIYQKGYDFSILLNPEFGKEMLESKLSRESYERIQELPKELMDFKSNPEPYIFHEDTCFLRQINLDSGNGKWLSLENVLCGTKPDLKKIIKYSTHNFDYMTNSSDVLTMIGLFDLYISYSEHLRR